MLTVWAEETPLVSLKVTVLGGDLKSTPSFTMKYRSRAQREGGCVLLSRASESQDTLPNFESNTDCRKKSMALLLHFRKAWVIAILSSLQGHREGGRHSQCQVWCSEDAQDSSNSLYFPLLDSKDLQRVRLDRQCITCP